MRSELFEQEPHYASKRRWNKRWKVATAGLVVAAALCAGSTFAFPAPTMAEEAPVSAAAEWESPVPSDLPATWSEAVVAVAKSQLGYAESTTDVVTDEAGEAAGSTRYGAWSGNAYAEWNTLFAQFCLEYAGVENMPQDADAQKWVEALDKDDAALYAEAAVAEPEAGDVVFFQADDKDVEAGAGDAQADRVGIVTEVTPETDAAPAQITVVEGDVDGAVKSVTYDETDEAILGYAELPEQPADDEAEDAADEVESETEAADAEGAASGQDAEKSDAADEADAAEDENAEADEADEADTLAAGDTVDVDDTVTYEAENFTVELKVDGTATVVADAEDVEAAEDAADQTDADEAEKSDTDESDEQAETEAADEAEGLAVEASELGKNDAAYKAAQEFAEQSEEQDVVSVDALDFTFTYNGQPLSVEACEVTAEVAPTKKLQSVVDDMEIAEDAEEEVGAGVELTALDVTDGQAEELDTVTLEQGDKTLPKMTVALNSADPALQVVARSAINPHFTVQYYAYLDVVQKSSDGALTVIDTDAGGKGTGGNLPKNGETPRTTKLELVGDGKKSSIKSEKELTLLYEENQYSYYNAPDLRYFNVMAKNPSYKLAELWVLKEGKNAGSTNRDDWTIYENPENLEFTNNQGSANDSTVWIKDGAVIRLVADTTKDLYNNAATFYDYDITDDGKTTWDGTNGSHGINSSGNYTGSGAKFAFGNANTGMGLHNENWNGNTLNQYNHSGNGYLGCTFGLVTGLAGDGTIQYANGVNAPKLFNDGNASGKKTYTDWSLDFNRSGDTYTLTAVNGAGLTGLEYFNNPVCNTTVYTHIWTNNFWPMDSRPSVDGKTGYFNNRGGYSGSDGNRLYPMSDDGVAHNNMFGMQYQVSFTLTEDYCGPLEYYFFGDDDMWVFLDGRLVCDIGGVHSSVGQYVNLWDYIDKGDAGTHTLSFFYTERGLSGSTCYMQFTLPSVSSVPVQHDTGKLTIQKEVVGTADSTQEFTFDIELSDTTDVYAIQRYDEDGNLYGEDGPSPIEGGKGTFTLKDGEYVEIDYLPYETTYTITETNVSGGCTVSNTVNDGETSYSVSASGTISEGQDGSVVFTNRFMPKLPQTGGPGTLLFSLGGAALVCASAYGFYRRRSVSR